MIPDRRCSGVADRRKTRETDSTPTGKTVFDAQSPVNSVADIARLDQVNSISDVLTRESSIQMREDAVGYRELQVLARETSATDREQTLRDAQDFTITQQDLNRQLVQANENLVIASIESHAMADDLEKSRAEMAHLANHDFLTDLPNRLQLYDRISQAITFATRHRTKLAVLFLDLDRFKSINDSLGHAIGDLLLRSVAERLQSAIRRSDTVSRQGGDEFVLLLSEVNEEETLRPKIEKIRQMISEPYRIAGNDLNIGVTIGVSIFPEHGDDTEKLIRCADLAMYHAKQRGRNQYEFYSANMRNNDLDNELAQASIDYLVDLRQLNLF
jgi:diguanylate cyclase